MKIPFPDQQPVASAALPTPFRQTDTRDAYGGAMADAFGKAQDAAQSLEADKARADAKAKAEAEKARAEAYAVAHANADAAYQRAETDALVGGSNRSRLINNAFGGSETPVTPASVQTDPGFLETRGLDASAMSARTIDDLEKKRQEIAARGFTDPVERNKWLARNASAYQQSVLKVEQHVAQQGDVAADDALHGKLSTSLNAAASDPYSDPGLTIQSAAQSIRALQKSKEGGDAAVQKFSADLARARINGFLDVGDVDRAAKQYAADEKTLGVEAPAVHAAVSQALEGRKRDLRSAADETDAAQIVKNATPPGGYVDENKALAQLEGVPVENRSSVRAVLLHNLSIEADKKKNDIEDWKRTAWTSFNRGGLGAVKGELLDRLNRFDPAFVEKLQNEQELRWRRAKSDKTGDAAARREQASLNRQALNDFLALPAAERATQNLDTFLAGRGVDDAGASAFGPVQRRATEDVAKGYAERADGFVADSMAAAQGVVKSKPDLAAFKASATQAYNDFVTKNQRVPSKTEAQALISEELLAKSKTKPRFLESLIGQGEEAGWQQLARKRKAPAAQKVSPSSKPADFGADHGTPSSYAYSPDRKQRRPRYADGSLGPVEQVP